MPPVFPYGWVELQASEWQAGCSLNDETSWLANLNLGFLASPRSDDARVAVKQAWFPQKLILDLQKDHVPVQDGEQSVLRVDLDAFRVSGKGARACVLACYSIRSAWW